MSYRRLFRLPPIYYLLACLTIVIVGCGDDDLGPLPDENALPADTSGVDSTGIVWIRVVYKHTDAFTPTDTLETYALRSGTCDATASGATIDCWEQQYSGVVTTCSRWTTRWPGLECLPPGSSCTVEWDAYQYEDGQLVKRSIGVFGIMFGSD